MSTLDDLTTPMSVPPLTMKPAVDNRSSKVVGGPVVHSRLGGPVVHSRLVQLPSYNSLYICETESIGH